MVIIARENNFVIESITLFSYLFCAFLLVTAVFWLLNIFIRSKFRRSQIRNYWQLSIRTQIHGTIIFISVLSFLIIGVGTILFFIRRYENSNREKLSRTIHVMENEVRHSLADLAIFDDVVKVYDEGYREKLEQIITKISEIHAADINLYDLEGNLRTSSLFNDNAGTVNTYDTFTVFPQGGGAPQVQNNRTTYVYIKQNGQWRIVSAHFSPLPPH